MNRIESLVVLSASAVRFHGFTQQPKRILFFLAGTALASYFIICARPEPLELQQNLHKEGIDEGKVVVQSQRSCRYYRYVQLQRDVMCDVCCGIDAMVDMMVARRTYRTYCT